jgi:hypothetical protein
MKPKPQEKTRKATCRSTPRKWPEMNRKQRREMIRKIQSEDLSLQVVHRDAAGIDIGNESHYVAVPPDTGQPTGMSFRVHHSRGEGDGRLAEAVWDSDRSNAVDWRLLDRGEATRIDDCFHSVRENAENSLARDHPAIRQTWAERETLP